ncbi:hypothetical protein ACHWUR_00405 [Klebsiella pneumoniae]
MPAIIFLPANVSPCAWPWRWHAAPYRWRMLGAPVALRCSPRRSPSVPGQGIRLLEDQGSPTASPELLNRYILAVLRSWCSACVVGTSCASTTVVLDRRALRRRYPRSACSTT